MSFSRLILAAISFSALGLAAAGCGADNCTGWTYGGCCGLGNKAQFIRTCTNPDGTQRTETYCSSTCS
jgi:hypothetical protein